jgi:hypothetical protein
MMGTQDVSMISTLLTRFALSVWSLHNKFEGSNPTGYKGA